MINYDRYKLSQYNLQISDNSEKVLLFNTFSGSVCRLEKDVWDFLQRNTLGKSIPYFDKLLNQGYIVPAEQDELGKILTDESIAKYSINNEKLIFVIAPTLQCNLKCFYCFEPSQCDHTIMSKQT